MRKATSANVKIRLDALSSSESLSERFQGELAFRTADLLLSRKVARLKKYLLPLVKLQKTNFSCFRYREIVGSYNRVFPRIHRSPCGKIPLLNRYISSCETV